MLRILTLNANFFQFLFYVQQQTNKQKNAVFIHRWVNRSDGAGFALYKFLKMIIIHESKEKSQQATKMNERALNEASAERFVFDL